ncbi:hypothetical protein ACIA31_06300 [Lactobacillus delbrueckii subsp. bulgaricus]
MEVLDGFDHGLAAVIKGTFRNLNMNLIAAEPVAGDGVFDLLVNIAGFQVCSGSVLEMLKLMGKISFPFSRKNSASCP